MSTTEAVCISLPRPLIERLDNVAKADARSRSNMVSVILGRALADDAALRQMATKNFARLQGDEPAASSSFSAAQPAPAGSQATSNTERTAGASFSDNNEDETVTEDMGRVQREQSRERLSTGNEIAKAAVSKVASPRIREGGERVLADIERRQSERKGESR